MSQPDHDETRENPYQAPAPHPAAPADPASHGLFALAPEGPGAIRGEFLKLEATVMTIGLVQYLQVIFGLLGAVILLIAPGRVEAMLRQAGTTNVTARGIKVVLVMSGGMWALIGLALGSQLRALKSSAPRWAVVVLNGVLIFGQGRTVGTLFERGITVSIVITALSMAVNLYIVYTLLMAEDGTVFSKEYQTVISLTPNMKPRMSVRDYLLVFAVLAMYALGLLVQLIGSG